ncbi:hypothetical protein C8Q76DRAFT_80207 [Earliella scabrosa]|nr:hypothetical protein C8Q76DRAFT_80207 [Earliella scabrosa]
MGLDALFQSLIAQTFGAYLIGTFIATMLYGFAVHQTYRYSRLFRTESPILRVLVLTLLVLQTVHVVLNLHSCYFYLVAQYGSSVSDLAKLQLVQVWSILCLPVITSINMLVSQLFFVRRVFLMGSYYRIIAWVAAMFFVAELGVSIGKITVNGYLRKDNTHAPIWLAAVAVAGDTLLTASIAKGLCTSRDRGLSTSSGTSERIWNMVISYGVNTGLLHDVLNIVTLCLGSTMEKTLLATSVNLVSTRAYFITLLTVLNTRNFFISREIRIFDGGDRLGMNIIARAETLATKERWNVPQMPDATPAMININVTTEKSGPSVGLVSTDSGSASEGGILGKCDETL